MVSDPVGDFIIQLKNASAVGKEFVVIPYSKLKFAIAQKLQQREYARSVSKRGKKVHKYIEVGLMYKKGGNPIISGASRISKPSKRVYKRAMDIRSIKQGKGVLILSTPKGVLTGEEARKEKVGGEALFKIW
jgi:small subunit ribosomal protein S8